AASDTAPEIYAGSLPFDCMPDLQFAHPEATIRSGSGYPDWSKKSTQEIIELKLLPCLFEKANGDAKAGFQSDSLSNVFLGSNLGYFIKRCQQFPGLSLRAVGRKAVLHSPVGSLLLFGSDHREKKTCRIGCVKGIKSGGIITLSC